MTTQQTKINSPASEASVSAVHLIGAQDAITQQPIPHPIAMHCCNIAPHELYILDDVINCVQDDEFPHIEVEIKQKRSSSKGGSPTEEATISMLYNTVVIQCKKENGRWKVYHVTVDFPRLLKGHNGWVIQDENTFLLALSQLLRLVDQIATEGSKGHIIPGIVPSCASYWSKIEFPLQFEDSNRSIFNALFNARHSEVRKPPLKVKDQTVTWKGSELTVRAYMKGLQLHEKYKHIIDEEDMHVLRIELELKKKKLREYFDIPEGCRLATFSFTSLYTAFQKGMLGLQGVFNNKDTTHKGTKAAKAIVGQCNNKLIADGVSADDLIDDYVKSIGLKKRQASTLRRDVHKLLEQSSTMSFLDYFPKDKPLPARNISPFRKSESGNPFPVEHSIPADLVIDTRIREAYSKVDSIIYTDSLKQHLTNTSPFKHNLPLKN